MRYLVLLYLLCTSLYQTFAQNHDYVWLLGANGVDNPYYAGTVIDFIGDPPEVYYEFRDIVFFQTNASICDSSGNLLFYTNGINIYNRQNEIMENGAGLNPGLHATAQTNSGFGYILTQGGIALEVPGNDSLYYLLHLDKLVPGSPGLPFSSKHFYYSLINMNHNNGLGKVVEKNQVIAEGTLDRGKLTATRHANGRDWWLLIRNYNRNEYISLLVTPSGIAHKGIQEIGNDIPSDAIGQAVFAPDGSKYANVHFTGSQGDPIHVSIYDFDRCEGLLSEPIQFTYADSALGGGIAISPNNRFLYISSFKYLYQYDLLATDIEASKDTIAEWDGFAEFNFFATTFYLAQLGPDGKIYINSNNGVSSLHVIENPDLPGDSSNVCQRCLDIPTVNNFSLPNFPNYRLHHLEGSPCDTLRQPPTALFRMKGMG